MKTPIFPLVALRGFIFWPIQSKAAAAKATDRKPMSSSLRRMI
jgi:hypothetical protein